MCLLCAALHQSCGAAPPPRDPPRYKVVSTIISAANRKIRHKEKTKHVSGGSADDLSHDPADHAVAAAAARSKEPGSPDKRQQRHTATKEVYVSEALTAGCRVDEVRNFEVTRYSAYHFDVSGGGAPAQSTENAKPCMRRTQSSESLLGLVGGGGGGGGYSPDFTLRPAQRNLMFPSYEVAMSPLSPQLRCEIHFKRQLHAKQQFLLQQPQQLRAAQQSAAAAAAARGSRAVRAFAPTGNGGELSSSESTPDT